MTTFRIVVGVDGSEGGRRALSWAVHDAAVGGGTVQAINAWRRRTFDRSAVRGTGGGRDDEAKRSEGLLVREIEAVPNRSGVMIAAEAVEGRAADVLTDAGRNADLLVLGSHGNPGERHLGPVSLECLRYATCPIVVLPLGQPVQSPAERATRVER